MKTQKQVIDEYLNRQNQRTYTMVRFRKYDRCDGYSNVTNIIRDGIPVEKLTKDSSFHSYECDTGYSERPHDSSCPLKWTHRDFFGQVV